ncbi:amidohydrolase family protein [Streptomyces chartreusis]
MRLNDHDVVDLGPYEVSLPPDPEPRRPTLALPPGAWDMHCHVIGPVSRFPYARGARSTPPDATAEDLGRLHAALGIERTLIVQSVAHGSDHRVLLDALRKGEGRHRGVALLTPEVTEAELDVLQQAGVRGMRVHFLPALADVPTPGELDRLAAIARARDWHIELHLMGADVLDQEDTIASLGARVVIDHMARFDLASSAADARLAALLRLLDAGHVWVKLSGIDRLSIEPPPFTDAVDVARTLTAHAPERMLWGTDFPHPQSRGWTPSDAYRAELIEQFAPTEADRRRLLVENPLTFLNAT